MKCLISPNSHNVLCGKIRDLELMLWAPWLRSQLTFWNWNLKSVSCQINLHKQWSIFYLMTFRFLVIFCLLNKSWLSLQYSEIIFNVPRSHDVNFVSKCSLWFYLLYFEESIFQFVVVHLTKVEHSLVSDPLKWEKRPINIAAGNQKCSPYMHHPRLPSQSLCRILSQSKHSFTQNG